VSATRHLAQQVQDGVVKALDPVAAYKRQDRGISAVNFFIVAPPLFVTTPQRPDPLKQPRRGALMPAVLTEVGSITLAAEHDLLLSPMGQAAAAQGIGDGLRNYFTDRPLAVRYDANVAGGEAGAASTAVPGAGPPFWAPVMPSDALTAGIPVRLTNTGTATWPADLHLVAGWAASDEPYLRLAPDRLSSLRNTIPALAPGESVEFSLLTPAPNGSARQILWITLAKAQASLTDLGSPPLQLASKGP
jgi:hypothetical protein